MEFKNSLVVASAFATLLSTNAFANASRCAGSGVNGWNTSIVNHFSGSFIEKSGRNWVENNSDGRHTYQETYRDQWSVYLRRTDGYYDLQLDLWQCAINFKRPFESSYRPLYQVKSAY